MTIPLQPLIRQTRLALQEFVPHMAALTLPGGTFIALTGWVHQHWPLLAAHTRRHGPRPDNSPRGGVQVEER
jgi:hypothetical protein